MDEATSLLFDLDGFRVVSVVALDDGEHEVLVRGDRRGAGVFEVRGVERAGAIALAAARSAVAAAM